MNKKFGGFTLIELVVVVGIIGILAAVAVVTYNGYIRATTLKSVENLLHQMALGQTEFISDNGAVYPTGEDVAAPCAATAATTLAIENNLLLTYFYAADVLSVFDLFFECTIIGLVAS